MVIIQCFYPDQYANIDAVDFEENNQDDTRAYRVVSDRKEVTCYIKNFKRYNTGNEILYIRIRGKTTINNEKLSFTLFTVSIVMQNYTQV
jgi:hypothetical protein